MSGATSSGPVGRDVGSRPAESPSRPNPASADHTRASDTATSRVLTIARESWHILAVLGAFVISMLFIPVMTNVPVGDDWVYTRSVEILMREGRVEILDLSVVTLIFQIFWGALFSVLFGTSFGAMRLSTTVLFLFSGVAMYGLCLEMGVRKARAALGAAIYLFNPLSYVLAFTFMTDPQFTSLMVISSYFYVRGLSPEHRSVRYVMYGSVFAAFAFLVRQQGLLIPFAAGLYLLAARRWRPDRDGVVTALQVAAAPFIAMVCYYVWLIFSHGTPEQQGSFIETIRSSGWASTRLLTFRMTYIELSYAGFFVLPIAVAGFWFFLKAPKDPVDRKIQGLHWFVLFMLMIAGGMIAFSSANKLMPFVSQYLGLHGLGPQDLIGNRDLLVNEAMRRVITWVIFGSTALFAILITRRFRGGASPERATASLVAALAIGQVAGIMPPSFHFADLFISVDRYLLPLLPFAIALALWSVKELRLAMPVAWIVTAALALYSIAGTRDFLVFQEATWDMGRTGLEQGITYDRLDAGAGWDGYYLYDAGIDAGLDKMRSPGGSPWWTDLFARATDSSYIVTSSMPMGWGDDTVVAKKEYSSWLNDNPQYLYLLRRPGYPGPP